MNALTTGIKQARTIPNIAPALSCREDDDTVEDDWGETEDTAGWDDPVGTGRVGRGREDVKVSTGTIAVSNLREPNKRTI